MTILIFINSSFSCIMRNVCIIKEIMFNIYPQILGYIYRKKSWKIFAASFSSLTNLPFSSTVIFTAYFIMLQIWGFIEIFHYGLYHSGHGFRSNSF